GGGGPLLDGQLGDFGGEHAFPPYPNGRSWSPIRSGTRDRRSTIDAVAADGAHSAGSSSREAEFMQKRSPVGWGPSGNRWPRWASQRAQLTSVRTMPWLRSSFSFTRSSAIGFQNDGHPDPLSYFASDSNSS